MLTKSDFEEISELRHRMRRFLRFSEQAVQKANLTPLQYLLLLHLHGYPGRDWATIAELAERLQAKHHGVVALVSRCEKIGLVVKHRGRVDRREVHVKLLAKGRQSLLRLALLHRAELRVLRHAFGARQPTAVDDD